MFLPQKHNLSKVDHTDFFHFILNLSLFHKWEKMWERSRVWNTFKHITLLLTHSGKFTLCCLTTLLWPSFTGRSGASFPLWKMNFYSFQTLHAKNVSDSLFIVYKLSYLTELVLSPNVFKTYLFLSIVQTLTILFFFNHKAYSFSLSLLKTASKHHHSNFPQIQIWSRHCQFPAVHGAQTRRPHQATVTRPGPCSCTNRTQESLHSSPASPTVSLAHKILVMTQWLFFSNALFDLV